MGGFSFGQKSTINDNRAFYKKVMLHVFNQNNRKLLIKRENGEGRKRCI
jgi:hypothetical protein